MTYDILCVISLAKPRCSGGQTRWTCELSGLCKVYNPKRWPAEGAVLFRPIMWLYSASVVLVWDSFLPFTLLWPYSSKVHLVLATALNITPEYIRIFSAVNCCCAVDWINITPEYIRIFGAISCCCAAARLGFRTFCFLFLTDKKCSSKPGCSDRIDW